jgi:hypothetical protein
MPGSSPVPPLRRCVCDQVAVHCGKHVDIGDVAQVAPLAVLGQAAGGVAHRTAHLGACHAGVLVLGQDVLQALREGGGGGEVFRQWACGSEASRVRGYDGRVGQLSAPSDKLCCRAQ